jgi:hypothetical protein
MIHVPENGRSIAHSKENDKYFAQKVHICKESLLDGCKTTATHIIPSD